MMRVLRSHQDFRPAGGKGAAVPHEVLDQVERFLTADGDRIFRLWFGERDYKKHFNLAIVERAEGGIAASLTTCGARGRRKGSECA